MIDDFGTMISAVMALLQTEVTLYGVSFSWWNVFCFSVVVGIVGLFLGGAFGGK